MECSDRAPGRSGHSKSSARSSLSRFHTTRVLSNQPTHLVWMNYNHEMCGISCHRARRAALSPAPAYAHDLDCDETTRSFPEHRDELVSAQKPPRRKGGWGEACSCACLETPSEEKHHEGEERSASRADIGAY